MYFITITILDIIRCRVLYWKHNVSETRFCLRLQVEPTQLGPIDEANLCLRSSRVGSPEDGDKILSQKLYVLNRRQDNG
jgi:hypothetical protein